MEAVNSVIELAPQHKIGLPVASPVLIAGGMVGYGEAMHRGLDPTRMGAVVVGPISRRPLRGSEPPRLAETTGGFVLETGLQNRGVKSVLQKMARGWPRLGCPVVAQIVDNHRADAAVTAQRLLGVDGLMGLELAVDPHTGADELSDLIQAIRWENDLPLWAKLPLDRAGELAAVAVEAGADALVIGQPGRGALANRAGVSVVGPVYGPLTFALMLAALLDVVRLNLALPLIACGGIHTVAQARQVMAAGASALQLDSIVWVEPGQAMEIAQALAAGSGTVSNQA